jgi:hypothetical protein
MAKPAPRTNGVESGSLVLVPLPNGTYRALWMLEAGTYEGFGPYKGKGYFSFLILEGSFPAIPGKDELAALHAAKSPGGALPGREHPWKGCFFGDIPDDFMVVGVRTGPPKDDPLRAAEGTMVFQGAEPLRAELHKAWRMIHDRPALEAEWARAREAREQRAAERQRTRTLPLMLREKVFESWSDMWPPRVVREVRRIFRDATRDLIALQAKGTKRQRTSVLKRIVTELNKLDDKEGCIETVEREAVIRRIEELAALVGVSNEEEKLTGHRDW